MKLLWGQKRLACVVCVVIGVGADAAPDGSRRPAACLLVRPGAAGVDRGESSHGEVPWEASQEIFAGARKKLHTLLPPVRIAE